ncbi:glutathione S-transferase P 2-like [Eleutherodactylus coqui]|uniref:glutathione S-transferase P 2-like n=1 Tax=Eleutherodactylus coqui TaxID=57060 RepID=UPI00346379A5
MTQQEAAPLYIHVAGRCGRSLHRAAGDSADTMPGYTLTYFPIRGRAEPTRLLLADQGLSWTEDEVSFEDWGAGKRDLKKNAVFGQIPRFQDGDFVLYQSCTILRYLGRKYGLGGSNDKEMAIIEMMNDGVEDLRLKYYKFIFWDKEANKEKFLEELATQLGYFEKILSNNSNGTKFLVGDKITYADYDFLDALQCILDLCPTSLSTYPLLSGYVDRVLKRPKLVEYLKSEGRKRRPIIPKLK